MKYIELFDKYFLVLMVISSFIVIYFDGNNFIKQDKIKEYKQCKVIGYSSLIVSLCLFVIKIIV